MLSKKKNYNSYLLQNELELLKIKHIHGCNYGVLEDLQGLNGITGHTAAIYQKHLAEHEDWHRCIVDDYTFIDRPNKTRKPTHGYIQRQLITNNKADGEKFLEDTEKIFADIVARFPDWQTPDPIIRYHPKKGLYYRQLRFTYDENEKFLQVIPEYMATIHADTSKMDFVFDKYAATKADCCKFETPTHSASAKKHKKVSKFEYDYDAAISKFIATLTSPKAKKNSKNTIKRTLENFYRYLFPYEIKKEIMNGDPFSYKWVEDNVFGGNTKEISDYLYDYNYECGDNLEKLSVIFYKRLCSELDVQPSVMFIKTFYPLLKNELELLKIKRKTATK